MNATRLGRVAFRAGPFGPSTPYRGVQSKTPRAKRTTTTSKSTKKEPKEAKEPKEPKPVVKRTRRTKTTPEPEQYKGPTMSPRLMTFFGISVLGISTYCGYLYTSYTKQVAASQALKIDPDVSDRYNETASNFDAEIELDEKLMRLGAKRKALIDLARGDVLEVSCGTGRNIEFYELGVSRGVDVKGRAIVKGCRSLTFTDLSSQMLEIARKKFEALHSDFPVAFRVSDAKAVEVDVPGTKPWDWARLGFSGSKEVDVERGGSPGFYYDTVVQTMGLCSMSDPVGTLKHLGEITEPKNGRILLLEHGRSYYGWLNRVLDNLAPAHANRHGCWWNRDIGAIVEESGLEVVEEKRWHFGTTYRFVLRPKSNS